MLKAHARLMTKISVAIDVLIITGTFVMAHALVSHFAELGPLAHYLWALVLIIPVWVYLFAKNRIYESLRTLSPKRLGVALTRAHLWGAVIASSMLFLLHPEGFSRRLFVGFVLASLLVTTLEKLAIKGVLNELRRSGRNTRNILIAGVDEDARAFAKLIESHAVWGLNLAGFLVPSGEEAEIDPKMKILGTLEDLARVCQEQPIDEVVFSLPRESVSSTLENSLTMLDDMGITVRMILHSYARRMQRTELSIFHDQIPLLTIYSKPFDPGQLFLKRCLDIIGSLVGLGINVLLFPVLATAVKLSSPGPIFFGQERVGENGRRFKCWKYRSMYIDAEARKAELMHLNEMNGAIFKIQNDPRVTPVGAFLRKTSLDEFPQFWNVFCGEMSLVGTRPPTPGEVENYELWHRKRISIKPGITGLWQVSGRNEISDFDEIVRLDIDYIDRWSLWLDIKLLFLTIWVVLARRGSS